MEWAGLAMTLVLLAVVRTVWRRGFRLPARFRRSGPAPLPRRRPVEQIAGEARRLSPVVHHPPRGISFAKYAAHRHRYDRLLAAACVALEVDHLLDVLEPGPDLDRERERVETRLWLLGLRIDEVA